MRKKYYFPAIFLVTVTFRVAVAAESVKFPYQAGERFVVTTGYGTPPTHIGKDEYAIDLAQSGCDAYGKPVVASLAGTAWIVQEAGYNGGYGTELLIMSGDRAIARYAHLVPGSVPVSQGDPVSQGMVIGEIGDTGLVTGTACAEHPGTHIHFAMDTENTDGSFSAKDPEPISGYVGITAETWYVSDNAPAPAKDGLAELVEILKGLFEGSVSIVQPAVPSTILSSAPSAGPAPGGSRQTLPATPGAPSQTASTSPVITVTLPQMSPAQSRANGGTTSIEVATSSTSVVHSGGGSGPAGGFSVVVSPAPVSASVSGVPPAVTSAGSPTDDPSDDTVEACGQ